ncbi:MAG: CDP-diacylglycerol--glycerol-3-phosphate 3-phosphatidyltransferase [Pseudomonadota bacterium]
MIWTLPNFLTLLRILAAPAVGMMVVLGGPDQALWALLIFILAALTDFLDGWIARAWRQHSAFGQMLDPIADKAMVVVVLAALASKPVNATPVFLIPVLVILMREVLISGLREFLGDVKLAVTRLAKWKTTLQLIAIGALLAEAPVMAADTQSTQEHAGQHAGWIAHWVGVALLWLAALLTVATGWDYFRKALPYIRAREGN